MVNKEIIKIANKEYYILDEISNYVYLANLSDDNDLCIRKNAVINDKAMLVSLSDKAEVDNALKIFADAHPELKEEQ